METKNNRYLDVVAIGGGIVAGNRFSRAIRDVHTRAVDEQWMEEKSITGFGLQRYPVHHLREIENLVIHLVHRIGVGLLGIAVSVELARQMGTRRDVQTPVCRVAGLDRRPGGYDLVRGTEGKIVQILVRRMSGK